LAGFNRYIQQESIFWRRSLCEKAGGYVDASGRCGTVSDFELWVRFFRHAKLYPVDALIGGYRFHDDSLTSRGMEACHRIHDRIVREELERIPQGAWLKARAERGNQENSRGAIRVVEACGAAAILVARARLGAGDSLRYAPGLADGEIAAETDLRQSDFPGVGPETPTPIHNLKERDYAMA
jgi:hypothetical protein